MKILVCTDPHIGVVVGGYDMRPSTVDVLSEVALASVGCDLLVIMGDVFHTPRPTPIDYATFIEFLNETTCPVLVLRGNHDETGGKTPDALEPIRAFKFHPPEGLEPDEPIGAAEILGENTPWLYNRVFCPEYPGMLRFRDQTFLLAGYVSDGRARVAGAQSAQALVTDAFKDALDLADSQFPIVAGFCHLDVDGAVLGSEAAVMRGGSLQLPRALAARCDFPILNGHIHKKQLVGGNVIHIGSLTSTDFGDVDGEKECVVLEV